MHTYMYEHIKNAQFYCTWTVLYINITIYEYSLSDATVDAALRGPPEEHRDQLEARRQERSENVKATIKAFVEEVIHRTFDPRPDLPPLIPKERVDQLLKKSDLLVDMQMEQMQEVHLEVKQLPPLPKPKLHRPLLLPGETIKREMRCYLMADGRDDCDDIFRLQLTTQLFTTTRLSSGTQLRTRLGAQSATAAAASSAEDAVVGSFVPAEGALFLTEYRLVFTGLPCDPTCAFRPVIRSIPVGALLKEKNVMVRERFAIDNMPHLTIHFRAASFQVHFSTQPYSSLAM